MNDLQEDAWACLPTWAILEVPCTGCHDHVGPATANNTGCCLDQPQQSSKHSFQQCHCLIKGASLICTAISQLQPVGRCGLLLLLTASEMSSTMRTTAASGGAAMMCCTSSLHLQDGMAAWHQHLAGGIQQVCNM